MNMAEVMGCDLRIRLQKDYDFHLGDPFMLTDLVALRKPAAML